MPEEERPDIVFGPPSFPFPADSKETRPPETRNVIDLEHKMIDAERSQEDIDQKTAELNSKTAKDQSLTQRLLGSIRKGIAHLASHPERKPKF